MQKKIIFALILLLIVGLSGSLYYFLGINKGKNPLNQITASPSPRPSRIISKEEVVKTSLSYLSDDEKKLFLLWKQGTAASSSAELISIAQKSARTGGLQFKGCQPTPFVLKVKKGAEIKIYNQDLIAQKLIFGKNPTLTLPAEATISAKINYPNTVLFQYHCGNSLKPGFLLITP